MAISLLDNLSIKKKAPDVARQLFDTVADMVAFSENYLPDVYECNVKTDGKRYRYMATNTVDATTGKWREVTGGESYWIGTKEEWEDLDKSTLAEGTIVYITNDGSDTTIEVYTKEETDDLLDEKLSIEQDVADAGKYVRVDEDGNLALMDADSNEWTGTLAEWEALDKDGLKDGTIVNITDDSTESPLANYYNKAQTDELLDKKLDIEQTVGNAGKAVKVGTDGNITVGSLEADYITYTVGGVKKNMQSNLNKADGLPILDANGKILASQLPTSARQIVGYVDAENTHTLPTEADYESGNELIVTSNGYILQSTAFTLTSGKTLTEMEVANANALITAGYVFTLSATSTLGTVKTFATNKVTLSDDTEIALPYAKDLSASSTPATVQIPVVVGDELMLIDGHWMHLSNTSSVTSVNGKTGAVVIDAGGDAENIEYENEQKTDWDNVKKALDGLIAKVYYVKPSITSFTATPSTTVYEKGQKVSSLAFAWSLNKDVTTQTLTGCTVTTASRSANYDTEISAKKVFTLSVGDGENTDSKSFTVDFQDKIYYGSASTGTYDSDFILALANKKFATATKGSYAVNVATNQYGFIAYPKSMTAINSVYIGGFETTVENCGDVSFTNASGYTSTYTVVRTGRSGLGSITMEVK